MILEPFWTDGFEQTAPQAGGELPEVVDVAIVGAGYTGLSAARMLAANQTRVAVLEQETVGWGASSRNGGLLTAGLKASIRKVMQRYGADLGRAFWQASLDAVDLVEEIIIEEDIDCHLAKTGNLALASKPSHFKSMRSLSKWLKEEMVYSVRLLGPGELREEIGSRAYYGGWVDERGAGIHPARYVWGLADAALRNGAAIYEHTRVVEISYDKSKYRIKTNEGVLQAKEVLVATNGYTSNLVPELKPRIFPVGSYIIVTEPLPDELAREISPNGRMFYDTKNFLNYFRLTLDNRMLFGGRNDLSTDLDLTESALRLRKRMLEVFPQLVDLEITHSWSGQLGITFDLMPHIGRVDGIFYALGYGGHGISLATYLGVEIGSILAGLKASSPFMEIAHPTRFFYRQNPWFIPFAAQYYRLMDRFF